MKTRMLVGLLLLGGISLVAVLVPLLGALASARTQALALQRGAALTEIVELAATTDESRPVSLQRYLDRFFEVHGESVRVVDGTGRTIAGVGELVDAGRADRMLLSARRNLPQYDLPVVLPWSPEAAPIAAPVRRSSEVARGAAMLVVDVGEARADVTRSWAIALGAAVLLLAALIAFSLRFTDWVLRPVRILDAAATDGALGTGGLDAVPIGPPEIQHLSESVARMTRAREEALERQRGLVADVSHQLRNPLSAMRYRVDDLLADDPTSESVTALDTDLERLSATLDRLLALAEAEQRASSRPDHGASAAEHVTSADALVALFRQRRDLDGLRLVSATRDEVVVGCRRSDLEDVVFILLENTRKYAGVSPTASVALRAEGDRAVLRVSDDGPGLPDGDLPLVGQRFWRAAVHRSLPGTGLGHAVLAAIVDANRGTVSVSRGRPSGLTVTVTFAGASWS
ncbi:sensor histidine kinase [Microbacterium thalli]|uniref:sensor histidine kinase n=1 Tax=Microbacterium thalli TaxID=3027921 RepID=UPI0023661C3E|nr:HAMP domain-containing sensor histidine kinase [Microbacterium thalli]MDD7929161.1 HAMP domain-containing sensor histidine kinase [Microbacterium thalli]